MLRTIFFILPSLLFSYACPELFNKFPNHYFVETGSLEGAGIEGALKAGFSEIHSIELFERWYLLCTEKFKQNPNVHLWQGDSSVVLEEVISEIREPITFWLDGHWSGQGTALGETKTPIMKELEAIQRHPIKTHTILIDDVRCFGTDDFDFIQLSEVTDKILEINPNYVITYESGRFPMDILVARIISPAFQRQRR